MKYFKKLVLAVALAAAGTCSAATSFDEGAGTDITLSSAGEYIFTGGWSQGGDSDTWTFDLADGFSLRLWVVTPIVGDRIDVFSATLDGNDSVETNIFYVSNLSSGLHTLKLRLDDGVSMSEYSGSLVVTAVPEPETYAMFLAGLGIMGALARRRKPA